ncbi:hypothetical protein [Candidatus Chlamydia sanziniae]|uniref:Uncharacterized protein n=1 Tax=Candidatus Chlamydia sanziniae TaxID=1806891 RepID=A0A1A9HVJ5_9CHLA|nr:hypothetical protein [Candidatus Chlamydia sanziniae]ANH79030.1 hypothetical protein Cs308_0860 [Candidatus Chlamydia sanziniae]
MSYFNLSAVNAQLKPISEDNFYDPNLWSQNYLKKTYSEMTEVLSTLSLKQKYKVHFIIRIGLVALGALFILSILVAIISLIQAQLVVFSWPVIVGAILIPLILFGGGGGILYSLGKKVDIFAATRICLFDERRWVFMPLFYKGSQYKSFQFDVCMDLSTLDHKGSGIALVYRFPYEFHVLPIFIVLFLVLSRMVYNLIRFFIIPFYILFRMVYDYFFCKSLFEEERFIYNDIVREMGRSLAALLKAPFYGSAYIMTTFYALLSPLAGRVALGSLERDWNDDVIYSRAHILFAGNQKNFHFEGEGNRLGLGQHGCYSLRCCQPVAVFLFKEGKIISGGSPSIQYVGPACHKAYPD